MTNEGSMGGFPGGGPAGQGSPGAGARYFDRIRATGYSRDTVQGKIGGVCAGLARRWDVSAGLVRIGAVLLALLGIPGCLFYGALWLLLPQEGGTIHLQEAVRGRFTAGFWGSLALVVLSVFSSPLVTHTWPLLLVAVVVGGGYWWYTQQNRRRGVEKI